MKRIIPILAGIALSLGAVAAAQDNVEAKAAEAAPAEAHVVQEPEYIYSFKPVAKRDPFRSPLEQLAMANSLVNEACHDPLCQFDLGQLSLVAVVTGDANPFAMLEDPQGRGHVVRRNTRIGRQGGKVTQILGDAITVTEYVSAPDGKATPFPSSLKLAEEAQRSPQLDLLSGKTVP